MKIVAVGLFIGLMFIGTLGSAQAPGQFRLEMKCDDAMVRCDVAYQDLLTLQKIHHAHVLELTRLTDELDALKRSCAARLDVVPRPKPKIALPPGSVAT